MTKYLKWETWAYGFGTAVIGGGAGAVTATVTAGLLAPNEFNLTDKVWKFITLAVATFVLNGAYAAFKYLQQSPLPELGGDTTVTVKTEVTTSKTPEITETKP